MRSNQELLRLKEQAIALRRAGKSRRQIKEILGIVSNATLDRALQGVPPPEWTPAAGTMQQMGSGAGWRNLLTGLALPGKDLNLR
jgi:hypothetical protein